MRLTSLLVPAAALLTACSSGGHASSASSGGAGGGDAGADAPADAPHDVTVVHPPDGSILHPCELPGSVQFTASGTTTVPGGQTDWASLAFLHLPAGFCAHYYGTVGDARQLRFAPGGELFVASPTAGTTGGNPSAGQSAIVILPDDDLDGVADAPVTFLSFTPGSLMGTVNQGLLFTKGYFYYQDGTPPATISDPAGEKIMRMPYVTGQRAPSPSEMVADITYYSSHTHWPKTLDMADDGTLYVGNGGDQGETCVFPHPFHGGILQIDPAPGPNMGGIQIARGLRNPISVRCARGHNRCFALELAKDYTPTTGGREKLVLVHKGDDWGFPCCATKNLPYVDSPAGTDCSMVSAETNSFLIGDTPFDLDFERGFWPAAWAGRVFVVTHGAAGTLAGARMVAIPMDPSTGLPSPSTNINNVNVGMVDFATGWDDGTRSHGRPSAVAFAPDGRLFVANDTNGVIFWIAPLDM